METFLPRKQARIRATLIMALAVWAAIVGSGLQAGKAGVALALRSNTRLIGDPPGALKTPLTTANRGCDFEAGGMPGIGRGTGFVVLNKTGSGKLIANVVLMNAAPFTTYNVRLIQTPNSATNDCGSFLAGEATLTTDAQGNGSVNYQEPVLSGAQDAFVAVNNATNSTLAATDFYTTQQELFFSSDPGKSSDLDKGGEPGQSN